MTKLRRSMTIVAYFWACFVLAGTSRHRRAHPLPNKLAQNLWP